MPKDPFGGLGSRGSEQAVKASARAVRAYSNDLKRLLGMEQAVGRAAADRAIAASRAVGQQNTALDETTKLLESQGKSLTHLDRTRQKYHDAEITRTKALAYHYEKAKQFLTELREDSQDTSSVLGMFTRGMEEGAQNMLRFGALPKISTQLRDVNADAGDVAGSMARFYGAVTDAATMAQETGLNTYRENLVKLDTELALVSKRFNMADGSAKKLGNTIIQMAAVDMGGGDGAIAKVAELSAQLAELNLTAGVTAEQGMSFAIERAQQVGGSLATAVEELEHFSAMADITRKVVDDSNYGLTRFSASIREDFVRAMAEARRSIKGQAVDLENVGAAYQWASQQALKYGLSATGAAEFSGAIGQMTTGQAGKWTPENLFSGRRIQGSIRDSIESYKESAGIDRDTSYEGMTPAQQLEAQAAVGRGLGDEGQGEGGAFTREQLTSYRQSIEGRNEGAAAAFMAQERHASSQQGISGMLQSVQDLLGSVTDTSTRAKMIRDRYTLDVSPETATALAEAVGRGDMDEAAAQMKIIRDIADKATAGPTQTNAIEAVVAMKDPINELFNIKNYLKTIALNVDNIVGLVVDATGAVGAQYDSASRWTRDLLTGGNTGETEGALETRDTLQSEGRNLATQLAVAQEEHGSAGSDAARERAAAIMEALGTQIQENTAAQSENATHIGALAEEAGVIGRRSGPAPGSSPGAPTSLGEAASRGAGGEFLSAIVSQIPGGAAAVAAGTSLLGFGGSSAGGAAGQAGAPTSAGIAPPGTAAGVGEGSITVGADGSQNLTMSVRIDGLGEAIAYENSQQNSTRRS